jgi:hypothetical protein
MYVATLMAFDFRQLQPALVTVQKTFHGFLKMGDASIVFVQSPEIGETQPQEGVSHPSWTAVPVAAGAMQHPALNVDGKAELVAIRDRVRSHGYWVMGCRYRKPRPG